MSVAEEVKESMASNGSTASSQKATSVGSFDRICWVAGDTREPILSATLVEIERELQGYVTLHWIDSDACSLLEIQLVSRPFPVSNAAGVLLALSADTLVVVTTKDNCHNIHEQLPVLRDLGFTSIVVIIQTSVKEVVEQIPQWIGNSRVFVAVGVNEVVRTVAAVSERLGCSQRRLNPLLLHPVSLPLIHSATWSNPLCENPLAAELSLLALGISRQTTSEQFFQAVQTDPRLQQFVQPPSDSSEFGHMSAEGLQNTDWEGYKQDDPFTSF